MSEAITLYSSPISDCAGRLRIALNLKQLPYQSVNINLKQQKNLEPDYVALNPSGTIPTLVIGDLYGSGPKAPAVLTQSIAALEYLEEAYPDRRHLIPSSDQPLLRANMRTLVGIIANDIHPLTAPRVCRFMLQCFNIAPDQQKRSVLDWDVHWIEKGLEVYEKVVTRTSGCFSVGDNVTLADVCLLPELWTAEEMGVDLTPYPVISKLYRELSNIDCIREARQKGVVGANI
jgi:maleylacetoacetate isomerase